MSKGPETLLAFDVGTTSTRVAAIGLDGRVVRAASAPTPIERLPAGGEQLDPERVWEVLARLCIGLEPAALGVRAVGVSALLSTVFFDAAEAPLMPALLWSDERAAEYARAADGKLVADTIRIARRPLTGELLGPRLAWLAEHEPRAGGRVARVGSLKDALVGRLTGAASTDSTHASYTGLFDVAKGEWSDELVAAWGVDRAILPPVAPASARAGELDAAAARLLGLPAGIAVAVGGPDGTVGALGAGAVRNGAAVDIAGTTDVLMRVVDRPLRDESRATVLNRYVSAGLWGLGGPTGATGAAVEWVSRLLGYRNIGAAFASLGAEVEAIGPGAGGVTFRTELSGERFPGWREAAAGAVVNLRSEHGPAHLLRAAREGGAFTVAAGLEALAAAGAEVEGLTVAGGLARDEGALQMRADVCRVPVFASLNPEVTSLGAAALAGLACSAFDSVAEAMAIVPATRRFEPNPERAARYEEARARWQASRGDRRS